MNWEFYCGLCVGAGLVALLEVIRPFERYPKKPRTDLGDYNKHMVKLWTDYKEKKNKEKKD